MGVERKHDLPPRWDRCLVEWRGWQYAGNVLVCPPPAPRACETCGALDIHKGFSTASVNRGTVTTMPSVTWEMVERRRAQAKIGSRKPPLALIRLHVWRCYQCQTDTVWDMRTDEWWTLDDSDYGDEGSF